MCRESLRWLSYCRFPTDGCLDSSGVYLAHLESPSDFGKSPKRSKNHTFSCSEFALCIFSNLDAHRLHRLKERWTGEFKNRNRQGRRWEMMDRVIWGWKFKNQTSPSIWPWKVAGRAILLALVFWIEKASLVSCPTSMRLPGGYLKGKTAPVPHPAAGKCLSWLPCTEGWSPRVCCWRPLTTWPCLPHGFVFLFSRLPNTWLWQHRRVKIMSLTCPVLRHLPLNAPSWGCREK